MVCDMNITAAANDYVLITSTGRRIAFSARTDRAARGQARRLLGCRPASTYYQGDDYANGHGLRAVTAYCLGSAADAPTAALYGIEVAS